MTIKLLINDIYLPPNLNILTFDALG